MTQQIQYNFSWINAQYSYEDTDDEFYTNIFKQWETEFPNCPFNISLPNHYLEYLDEPFTTEPIIIIKDDRAEWFYNRNWISKNKLFNRIYYY